MAPAPSALASGHFEMEEHEKERAKKNKKEEIENAVAKSYVRVYVRGNYVWLSGMKRRNYSGDSRYIYLILVYLTTLSQ